MNQEIKSAWVAALRSGQYAQGRDRLRTGDEFCCLGVLCDLHAKATGFEWDGEDYLGAEGDLPIQVQVWAGLDSEDGVKVSIGSDGEAWLASHNDGQVVKQRTFQEIADAIEAQL